MTKTFGLLIFTSLLLSHHCLAEPPRWRQIPSTAGRWINALDIVQRNPDSMYAISDIGLLISTNGGEYWDTVAGGRGIIRGLESGLKTSPMDPRRIYATTITQEGGSNAFRMSTDGGSSWQVIDPGSGLGMGAVIEIDPVNPATVYFGVGYGFGGASTILRTTDAGTTWSYRPTPDEIGIYGLSIDPTNTGRLIAAYSHGFYRSADTGATWTEMNLGYPVRSVTYCAVHPLTGAIYVTCLPYQSNPGGVFKSTNDGLTWQELNVGIAPDNRDIRWIKIDPAKPDEMYVGASNSDFGGMVRYSSNSGLSWSTLIEGLPAYGYSGAFVIDTLRRRAFTGIWTDGDSMGIYVLDLDTDVAEPLQRTPTENRLFQNYPNPFNPTTVIAFRVGSGEFVSLKIYSMLGQEIATLVNEVKRPGYYTAQFDASHLPSGMYFCRLRSGDYVTSRKLLLLR
ncbi:MAG: T9SS type A sorting domain-containing protein [Bacteroidota bacterium]